jgi:hypothetical protein
VSGLQASAPDVARARWLLFTRIPCATPDLLLKHPDATVATYKRRQMTYFMRLKHSQKHLKTIANRYNIQMKHLQQAYETPETLEKYACNMHICNIQIYFCNIHLRQMKHLEHTLETYVYSHCNMCNILIYFCNTDTKHLQHTSRTSETYVCNMHFQRNISLMLGNGGLSIGVWSLPV